MKRLTAAILALVLVGLLLGGCAGTSTEPTGEQSVAIRTSLKQLGIGSSISRVVLEASGNGLSKTWELSLKDGIVHAEVEVPFGTDRVFELSAYSGAVLLYYGADTTDVSAGAVTEVLIYMRPQVPMIKVSPLYSSKNGPGVQGTLRVEVYNIDSLFGIAVRLEADSSIIHFERVVVGDFLGTEATTLFGQWLFPHYVAMGYTMQGNREPMGVSGSGLIATVTYSARSAGKTAITIDPQYLELTDWQGQTLPRSEIGLYIENGEVEILAP